MSDLDTTEARPDRIRGEFDFFLVSLLSLYLEILLIRWIGTEIRIFAYFSNLVLVVCFFGLGVGYATPRLRVGLVHTSWILCLVFALTHPLLEFLGFRGISEAVASTDLNTWSAPAAGQATRILGFARLALLLVLIASVFVPFGQVLGEYFSRSEARIRSYSVNVAGSVVGIWLFAILSFAGFPPLVWLGVGAGLLLFVLRGSVRLLLSGGMAWAVTLILVLSAAEGVGEVTWSAYQKLILREFEVGGTPAHSLEVNNTIYQYVLDLSDENMDRAERPRPKAERPYLYYNLPYRLHPDPKQVLVVGAGTGNDVAAALRAGAEHVDAVEIDRVIVDIGRRMHPERPYDDPRVTVVVDDARAHFKRTDARYDLIVFGLLDSHKLTSNFSNINLDSYVYTAESFREAHGLLRPGGVMVLSFQTFYPYIAWRLYDTLREGTGIVPMQFFVKPRQNLLEGTGGSVFFVGDRERLDEQRREDRQLDRYLRRYERAVPPPLTRAATALPVKLSTDDWPYLYVESPRVPSLWLTIIGIVIVLAIAATRLSGMSLARIDGQFFFLGAAFLFLETHTITRAQLFFGTTWVVSSIMITAILVMVLIGNGIVLRMAPKRLTPWYLALLAAALINWWVEPQDLLALGAASAAVGSATLAALPILFAAVIFGTSFAAAGDVRYAMSSNLLGALGGGLVECLSFVTGLRWIALLAVLFYGVSWGFLTWKNHR